MRKKTRVLTAGAEERSSVTGGAAGLPGVGCSL